jgi:hypothetical protein
MDQRSVSPLSINGLTTTANWSYRTSTGCLNPLLPLRLVTGVVDRRDVHQSPQGVRKRRAVAEPTQTKVEESAASIGLNTRLPCASVAVSTL